MTLADFYLLCFLVGFLLSVMSLGLGSLGAHVHLPHAGDGFHLHFGDAGHVGDLAGHVGHGTHAGGSTDAAVSPFNFATIAAFLAWFGGTGYLLTRWSSFWSIFGLGLAVLSGLAGGTAVFVFLAKLSTHEENLDPQDYEIVGVLGRVTSGIRAGGTGEIVYSQQGTRHTTGARSDDGSEILKGTEVVVTRYDKGIAYVQKWEEMAGDAHST